MGAALSATLLAITLIMKSHLLSCLLRFVTLSMPGLTLEVKQIILNIHHALVCDHGDEVLVALGSIELAGQLDSLTTDGAAWTAIFIPC
jgi:hypothetical protein